MHPDLQLVIERAKKAGGALLNKEMSVKECNALTGTNHSIISAFATDLRERMFLAEEKTKEQVLKLNTQLIGGSD